MSSDNRQHIPNVPSGTAEIDQRLLDRLADGELADADRRRLLKDLERSTDGWRRCALTFLEAQAWCGGAREMLSAAREEKASSPFPLDTTDAAPRPAAKAAFLSPPTVIKKKSPESDLTWLALAACVMISFGLGFGSAGAWNLSGGIQNGGTASHTLVKEDPRTSVPDGANAVPAQDNRVAPEWKTMMVSLDQGADGRTTQIPLPVVDEEQVDPAWLMRPSPALPEELVRQWEQSGHQVVQYREFVPFKLEDGRRLIVPVDRVNIRNVSQ